MTEYRYQGPERVVHGHGALESLPEICRALGAERTLLLTTRSLIDTDLAHQVTWLLGAHHVGTISEVAQHVPAESVTTALRGAHEVGPDLIVSLGGGSVTDTAKALAVGLALGADRGEALQEHRIRFTYPDKVDTTPFGVDPVPVVCVPTTVSAAEYDGIFGMTSGGVKDLYADPGLVPRAVVLDPKATVHTPDRLWLGSGVKALDHAVETYLSRTPTPVTDALALRAMRLLATNLPMTRADPGDLDARLNCLVAGWLSMFGVADVTLGLSHGIGHQVGSLCGVPHGETSCVLLPVVLEHLKDALPSRLADIATALGADVRGLSAGQAADAGVAAVRGFIADLGLPTRLGEVGVTRAHFARIARSAMADMVVAFAPVPVTEQDVLRLLASAW